MKKCGQQPPGKIYKKHELGIHMEQRYTFTASWIVTAPFMGL